MIVVMMVMIITRSARDVLFSVVSVLFSVCQYDNSCTVSDIITKFSGHHPVVRRADKFESARVVI